MSFWFQQDQSHWLGNNLATQLLLKKVVSLEINASLSSSVEKDGSLRWNVHSKCKLLDQIQRTLDLVFSTDPDEFV